MFGFFKKKPEVAPKVIASPAVTAMRAMIDAQDASNPQIRAIMTGKDITENVLEMLKDEKGVRVENALGLLGALAGFSCSYVVMRQLADGSLEMKEPEIVIVKLKDGSEWLFGDAVNSRLVEGVEISGQNLSVWALIAGKVQQLGNPLTLDIKELFGRVAEAIGKPKFGHADLPDAHRPTDTPQDYVKYLFPKVLPLLDRYGLAPEQYFLALALSAQEVMQMAKGTIAPDLAAIILMEYAVPASKLTAVPKPT